MKIKADYHIHSTYSKNNHGKSTIEEIVEKAVEIGLEEIAITDHGPKHYLYGIKQKNIAVARKQIDELRIRYPQIKILFGVEANILDYVGGTDINQELLKNCDIILCGYHLGALFTNANDYWKFIGLNNLSKFSKDLNNKMIEKNTEAIVNVLYKNKINILTHPGDKIPVDIDKIAQAAEKTGTLLEISNSHGHLNSKELKVASKYDVNFVINSDSHIKDNIGGYKNGLKVALDAGIDLKRIINLV